MNTKRIFFWLCFVVVLGLIIWGLNVAMNKPAPGSLLGEPAPVTAVDNIKGSADAPVTVIEYADFQCPACATYMPLVERLFQEASSTLRVVYRHFPLPQHGNATIAAQASEAAALQGKFWEMYRLIYANQTSWESLAVAEARAVFVGYAGDLVLDTAKFEADLDLPAIKEKIDDQRTEGQTLGINATPTFFINGAAVSNPQGYEQFKALIDAAAN